MVRLDRITMQGFKSFAIKTTIPFPTGFNIIAGPNGSGKSNIVDALMFVLGTSSARSIRAQKLQNLLFNGAKDRKPADYCEVSLYLDNSDGKIQGYDAEVKIMRRINRSGVSVYKVNGKTVNRSRVLDILNSVNLSSESYNIIMQGDVASIIEMSPIERRTIIDDIAGISEFDDKKEKAYKELERVQSLISERIIIFNEKKQLVEKLKADKENAEKRKKLDDELRRARASLLHKKLVDAEKKLLDADKDIEKYSTEFGDVDKRFEELDKLIQKEEDLLKKLSDEIIKKSGDYELQRKISDMRTELIRKNDVLDLNKKEIERLQSIAADASLPVKAILDLKMKGVHGTVSNLVGVPKKYAIAIEVAIGQHRDDVVVDNEDTAIKCINFLKENKIGRARFIPFDKVRGTKKQLQKAGAKNIHGNAFDLVEFEPAYRKVFEYILGNTLVAETIKDAKGIDDFRVVTLDGDLKETSGAVVGGFYTKKGGFDVKGGLQKLVEENEKLEKDITKLREEVEKLKSQEQEESDEVKNLNTERNKKENELANLKKEWRGIFDKRTSLQNILGKKRVDKAQMEANRDNIKLEFEEYGDVKHYIELPTEQLQQKISETVAEINRFGPVNMRALEDYNIISNEYEELKKKLDSLIQERDAVTKIVEDVEKKRYDKFSETLSEIAKNFSRMFNDMTGGTGNLRLEEEKNIESGLIIEASLPGKGMLTLDAISGGEKTLTSLAFLFAAMEHYAAPFYIFDEVDAALDKANTKKITNMIKKYSVDKQFIVISHNDITIQEADKVFGVSMEEGVSKVFGLEMPKKKG